MKKNILKIALFVCFISSAAAQELHKLEQINISIDGTTREKSLLREMDLKEGAVFQRQKQPGTGDPAAAAGPDQPPGLQRSEPHPD